MEITTQEVKALRDKTGISIMQCRKALIDAEGDVEKALILLKKRGGEIAAKRGDRELGSGAIASYIHNTGAVGAMVELSCETDFVSKNEEFKALARELAMQVAASNPDFLSISEITEEAKSKAKEVFEKEVEGKPEEMKEKILEGKLKAYFKDKVLLEQDYIKNPEETIQSLLDSAVQKFGEKIAVARFVRFSVQAK